MIRDMDRNRSSAHGHLRAGLRRSRKGLDAVALNQQIHARLNDARSDWRRGVRRSRDGSL
jgi:hypothetical protein